MDFLACVWNTFWSRWPQLLIGLGIALGAGVVAALGAGAICAISALLTAGATLGPCLVVMLVAGAIAFVLAALLVIVDAIAQAIADCSAANVDVLTPVGDPQALTAESCEDARAQLRDAIAAQSNAQAALDRQAQVVRVARRRLRNARAAAAGIAAALAAAFLNPFEWGQIAGLSVALIGSLALVVQRSAAVSRAEARLSELLNEWVEATALVAAAQALVEALCGSGTGTIDPQEPGGGLNVALLGA